MKKRLLALLAAASLAVTALGGCGAENPLNGTAEETLPAVDSGEMDSDQTDSDQAESGDTAEVVELAVYPYEDELNILEDNYRNYYEIFVYSFYDSDGDGIGDLQGVIQQLDYVAELGFNGIWLMPIMSSTTYHKYDVTDYYSIDSEYGTMEDLEELIAACHERGIKLILDYVFNHTSAKHEWFLTACDYLEGLEDGAQPDYEACPYADYYHFVYDENGKSGTYYRVGSSNWYYEGQFWDQMPDLNLDNPLVRKELEEIAAYYLNMGIDGFRLDAAKEFFSGNTTKNIEVLQWFSDYVASVKEDAYLVAEVWEGLSVIDRYYTSGITSLFDFPIAQYDGKIAKLINHQSDASSFGRAMVTLQTTYGASNAEYIDAPFLANHDMARYANTMVSDPVKIKYAAGLLLSMNGSPFVYYGDEIALPSSGSKDENKRLPMLWSAITTQGQTVGPKDADPGIESKFPTVEEQMEDPLSIWNYYKRAVRIRNENPEIARGIVTAYDELSDENICVLSKEYEGSTIYIVYNMGEDAATFSLTDPLPAELAICDCLTVDGSVVTLENGSMELPAHSIVYLR